MKKNEITEFFVNIENTPDFLIRKWIYEQTNDLKPDLFCALSLDFKNYCESCVISEAYPPKKNDKVVKVLNDIIKNDGEFLKRLPLKWYEFEDGKIQQKEGFYIPNPIFKFDCRYLFFEFRCFQKIMHDLFKKIQPQQIEAGKNDEVYKTQNLFKVGLFFATGEMNKYFTLNCNNETSMKSGYSAGKIAKELGNVAFNKWILATINNYPTDNANGNKNVFNSLKMMAKINDHCKVNNLTIDPYFLTRMQID